MKFYNCSLENSGNVWVLGLLWVMIRTALFCSKNNGLMAEAEALPQELMQ